MRAGGIGTAIAVVILTAAGSGAARAQSPYDYPWCEYYLGRDGGGTSCYYTSYAQCMASARGNGAYCAQNPQYRGGPQPPPNPAGPRRHRRHRH